MSKNEIITEIYTNKEYDKVLKNICSTKPHFIEDLKQELILDFMKKDESLLQELYNTNKLINYFARAAKLQVASSTSPFYYKYRKSIYTENEITYSNSNDYFYEDGEINTDEYLYELFDIYKYCKDNNILKFNELLIFNYYYKFDETIITEELPKKMSYQKVADLLNTSNLNIYKKINIIKYKIFKHILLNNNFKLSETNKIYLTEYVNKHEEKINKNKKCK